MTTKDDLKKLTETYTKRLKPKPEETPSPKPGAKK